MTIAGGFLPRRVSQWACDPFWCLFAVHVGAYSGDKIISKYKLNATSLVHDPHRYVWTHH